jgi:hypothetical protein
MAYFRVRRKRGTGIFDCFGELGKFKCGGISSQEYSNAFANSRFAKLYTSVAEDYNFIISMILENSSLNMTY